MCSFPSPPTLQWSNPLEQAQTAHATCRIRRTKCTEIKPIWPVNSIFTHLCPQQLIFLATLNQFAIAAFSPFRNGRVPVSGGPMRVSEHRRLLPDIVRQAESTRGPEVLMGQMRSLHCEGQSFTSWEQSSTGIKSHIFRVTWPLTADTPPCARACLRSIVLFWI